MKDDLLNEVMARSGEDPEVALEATYGWDWAVDALQAAGARVHFAHPLGVKTFEYRRVKNDLRDAADLADLLRMGRLPEAWIAPPATRELRELVRHRAKLVGLRSHGKAEIHAVLAKCGIAVPMSDLFGLEGIKLLERRDHHVRALYPPGSRRHQSGPPVPVRASVGVRGAGIRSHSSTSGREAAHVMTPAIRGVVAPR